MTNKCAFWKYFGIGRGHQETQNSGNFGIGFLRFSTKEILLDHSTYFFGYFPDRNQFVFQLNWKQYFFGVLMQSICCKKTWNPNSFEKWRRTPFFLHRLCSCLCVIVVGFQIWQKYMTFWFVVNNWTKPCGKFLTGSPTAKCKSNTLPRDQ